MSDSTTEGALSRAELEAALDRAVAERDAWAQELFESNRFAAELVVARQNLVDELAVVTAGAAQVEAACRERNEAAWLERDQARMERDAALERMWAAEGMLDHVVTSTAWRITGPLRHGLATMLGRPRGRY